MAVILKRSFTVSVRVGKIDPVLMDLGAEVDEPVYVIVRQGKKDLLLVETANSFIHPVVVEVKSKPDNIITPNIQASHEKSAGRHSRKSLVSLVRPTSNNQRSVDEKNCDEAVDRDRHFREHGKVETNSGANNAAEKAYPCEHCDKSFVEPCDLKLHLITHHRLSWSLRQKRLESGVEFPERGNLVQRIEIHDEVKEVNSEPDCQPMYSLSVRDLMDRFNKPEPESLNEDQKAKIVNELKRVEENTGENSIVCGETVEKSEKTAGLLHGDGNVDSVDENDSFNGTFDGEDSMLDNGHCEKTAERVSPDEKVYQCGHCNELFIGFNDLKSHLVLHVGQNLQAPSASKKKVHASVPKKKTRASVPKKEKKYVCPECGKQLTTDLTLIKHLQTHRPDHVPKTYARKKRHECTYCEEAFVSRRELAIHISTHTGEKPFQCPICGKDRRSSSLLRSHMRVHSQEKPFKCTVCDKALKSSLSLKQHMLLHTGREPSLCSECGEEFRTGWQLVCHQNRVHNKDNPHKCNQCGKTFPHPNLLVSHMDVHVVEKSYQCSECGKLFTRRGDLRGHMWSHSDVKPYPCPMCDKSYARQQQLTRHLPSHNGKPYKCTHCGKSFHRESTLRDHETIHTGEKKYPCDKCGKTFASVRSRIAHRPIHKGGGPYVCEHCGKEFALYKYRTRHIRVVHRDIEADSSCD